MKEFFKDVLTDNITKLGFLVSFIIITLAVISVALSYHNLPPFLPIFNQLPWGEKRLGTTIQIFIPILIPLAIFLLNFITSPLFYKKNPLISRMLAVISLTSSILVFIFLTKIILSV